tara:strand:+ start:1920 stop:2312 length:393 start_codon:yes stop_codon:yes gene_type:complete
MDKKQVLSAFNDQFKEFVEDIHLVFPDNDDIATVSETLIMLRKQNPRLLLIAFNKYVVERYRTHIEAGNINFFIDKDYKNDLSDVGTAKIILEKIDCLREPIREMKPDEQNKVVNYMKNLVLLSDLYLKN